MRLRSQLHLVALGALLPMIVLAVLAAVLLVRHERRTMENEAIGRARATMSAVDAELKGHIETAQALATSRSLERGDLRAFHADAVRGLKSQPRWMNIGLQSANGMHLFDAVLPFGKPEPAVGDLESYERALATGLPAVGNVDWGPAIKAASVRIRVPVIQGDKARYVISVPLKVELFEDLLREQRLPEGWVIGLVDHNRRLIARLPPLPIGGPISDSFSRALDQAPEGFFRGETLEGRVTYSAYVTSSLSGWALGVAIPGSTVEAGARGAVVVMGIGLAVALAVAVWLAWWFGRRITVALAEREQLIEREKQVLHASDRAKDEFIAMLSHELRNPLAALTTAAEVLKMAPPAGEVAIKSRGVIVRQTKHMARLVEDLLDVSRVTMGKAALAREPIDIAESASSSVRALRAAGRFEGRRVSLDLQPAWADADRARIEQIVTNLLDNALKYTPAHKQIRLQVAKLGDEAVISVADEGDGLPAEVLGTIFDLFVQGERGLDRKKGGLGIGLALVKRLVELHGGTVSAESPGIGKGATFTVRLPAIAPRASGWETKARQPGGPRRILIVEDNDDVRDTLREALRLKGHEVHEASEGAQALKVAAATRPEIALIDIGLPDLDGFEVARRMRAQEGQIALVALTGYGQPQDEERAIAAGFDAHLVKPVPPERLMAAIAQLT